jgi:predicted Zn-dependent peptidase
VFVLEDTLPVPALGLTFRVGRVDETAPNAGITHLVEHLILPASIGQPVDFNGSVDELFTSMWARGDAEHLLDFLVSVVELLDRPPFDRLEVERRTLLAEEATQSYGGPRQAFALRYGPHGPGLTGYQEYGLRKVGASDVEKWIASRFARENAAVWISGVPPERLEIGLAAGGVRHEPVVPAQLDALRTPAVYAYGYGTGVCISLLGARSRTTALAVDALTDGLVQRLRYELGLSYSIHGTTQAVSESLTQLTVTADVADSDLPRWLEEALEVVDRMVDAGPDPAWLERAKDAWRRSDTEPASATGWVAWKADAELLGRPFQTHAEADAERDAVTPDDIAHYFADARPSLLVLGPHTTPVPAGFEEYPVTSDHRVEGKRHRPKRRLRERLRRSPTWAIVSADEGISLVDPAGSAHTALYDTAVVCLQRADERTLLSDDGFFVNLERADWTDADAIFDSIDAHMPEERVVRMDAEDGL